MVVKEIKGPPGEHPGDWVCLGPEVKWAGTRRRLPAQGLRWRVQDGKVMPEDWPGGPGRQTGGGWKRRKARRQPAAFQGERAVRPALCLPLGPAPWPLH